MLMRGEVRAAIRRSPYLGALYDGMLNRFQNRGRKADKHERFWRVYEVNHTDMAQDGLAPSGWEGLL